MVFGTTVITPVPGTYTYKEVPYGVSFVFAPDVVITAATTRIGETVSGVGVVSKTFVSVNIGVLRGNNVNTYINWVATDM
jgi:hypothetical protein